MATTEYVPGPASGARVEKNGELWTLILVRELRHAPEKVWQALTEPEHLREWAPFDAERNLEEQGPVKLTWAATGRSSETTVMRAEAPQVLELMDMRWELEPLGGSGHGGTRLTLWHRIDRRFVAWGAAGWHLCLDGLDRLLSGAPMGRMVGDRAVQVGGWHRLCAEYAREFGVEGPQGEVKG